MGKMVEDRFHFKTKWQFYQSLRTTGNSSKAKKWVRVDRNKFLEEMKKYILGKGTSIYDVTSIGEGKSRWNLWQDVTDIIGGGWNLIWSHGVKSVLSGVHSAISWRPFDACQNSIFL